MKKKINYDNVITLILFAVIFITMAYNFIFGNGDRLGRLILIAGTIIAVKIIFKLTFFKKSKASYISILFFIMISMYFGNVLNFYTYIKNYDKILHLLSGIIISIIGTIMYLHFTNENIDNINFKFMIVFSICFILACAGGWEIWEFTTDRVFGLSAQLNSLNDTMLDIICGSIGGILGLIFTGTCVWKKKYGFFKFMIDTEDKK